MRQVLKRVAAANIATSTWPVRMRSVNGLVSLSSRSWQCDLLLSMKCVGWGGGNKEFWMPKDRFDTVLRKFLQVIAGVRADYLARADIKRCHLHPLYSRL